MKCGHSSNMSSKLELESGKIMKEGFTDLFLIHYWNRHFPRKKAKQAGRYQGDRSWLELPRNGDF